MDENARKWYGIAAAVIVVFVAAAWYFSSHNKAIAPSNQNTATTTNATTGQTGTSSGGGSVQVGVGGNSNFTEPDLNRPYTPLSSLPASVQQNDTQLVKTAIAQLKIDPSHEAYWLQLAGYRKGANDFTGAEDIWVYCTEVFPTDPIAYNNLGDLYANYLHDYAKAETYWNGAIKLDPKNISTYLNLATMYDINLKDKADAQTTLQAGLKANPGNTDLQYALDHLQ